MTRLEIKFENFLDRSKLFKALDRKNKKVLRRQGAFYRTVVRRSMRPGGKKNKISDPGQPPRYHTKVLRNSIVYAFDPQTKGVEIGALRRARGKGAAALEYGGIVRIKGTRRRKKRTIRIRPRPFVGFRSINYKPGKRKFVALVRDVELK